MNKEKPVALLHSYLADRKDKRKPDRLTRTGILAAAELYRRGEIGKICITVKPELSRPQVKRLKTLLNNPPEEDIVSKEETVTTEGEVETFKKLAEEENWKNLLTIGNEAHVPRIKREIKRTFKDKQVKTTTPREILAEYKIYSYILKEMENWPEQLSLSFQEKILNTPIIGALALKTIPYLSRYKVALQSWAFERLEK